MSGHTEFTAWIACEAKYLIYRGSEVNIKTIFFTSVAGPSNCDEMNIKLKNGKVIGRDDDAVDWKDLRNRYTNSTPERKKQAEI